MCRVMVKKPEENVEFIIYNHIFSKVDYKFTISQLAEELHQYNLNLPQKYIQSEINAFIKSGLVYQNFQYYSICDR